MTTYNQATHQRGYGSCGNLAAIACLLLIFNAASIAAADLEVRAGIDGRGRMGAWAECHVSGQQVESADKFVVECIDGDAAAVQYVAPVSEENRAACYFQVPGQTSRMNVSLVDSQGQTLARAIAESPRVIPSKQKWILAIGDPIGIEAASDQQGRAGFPIVSLIKDGNALPHQAIGYSGIDLVVATGTHVNLLNTLAVDQRRALAQWIRTGGRMILALGGSAADAVADDSWVCQDLGISVAPKVVRIDPRAVESFTVTQQPLSEFSGLTLAADRGRTVLSGRTTDRQTVPIAKQYAVGFGRVVVFAADLDQEPFASWADRQNLLRRLIPDVFSKGSSRQPSRRGQDAGYSDLAGQIRRTMDQFTSHWVVPFKWIAGFLVLYLGLIGPIDYWIVNRLLGRPLLGWVTFFGTVLLFSGLALYGSSLAVPPQPAVNQFAVIDIDSIDSVGRGFAWSQYLNSESDQRDFRYEIDADFCQSGNDPLTGWWGIAGTEFGGLASTGRSDSLAAYSIVHDTQGDLAISSTIRDVPMPTAATRGLAAWWRFESQLTFDSNLSQQRGTDLLKGSLTNPLPVDLLDGLLVYHGWVCQLPTRLAVGGRIEDVGGLKSKNLKWRLTRRTIAGGATATEPWNAAMDTDLDRLMEIVMFHDAAGGSKYTQLDSRIVDGLDLSYILDTDRAILIGRSSKPMIRLMSDDQPTDPEMQTTFIRVLLPVDSGK